MKPNKIYIIVLLLMIIFMLISPVLGTIVKKPTTYRVLVDQDHGFYRVYEVYNKTLGRVISYQNGTLNINKGDTIVWINDAVPDTRLAIISQQKLWNNHSGELSWAYKQLNYTFNKSGVYEIYIKGYSKPQFKQKIMVGPIESLNTTKSNSTKTIKSNTNITNITNVTNTTKTTYSNKNLTNYSKAKNSSNTTNFNKNMTNISKNEKGKIKLANYMVIPSLLVAIISAFHIFNRINKNRINKK